MPHLLHIADHPSDGSFRILLQTERERQVEQQLVIRRSLDGSVQRLVHGQRQVTLQVVEISHQAIVDPDPASVPKWVAVGLLDGRARRGPDVGEEEP